MRTARILFAGFTIAIVASAIFAQQQRIRKPAGKPGMVQTVRIEKHQLLLLAKGAQINAATNNGETTLMYAVSKPDLAVVKFLIDNGADVNLKTKNGHPALSFAVAQNNNEAAELLRKAGAR